MSDTGAHIFESEMTAPDAWAHKLDIELSRLEVELRNAALTQDHSAWDDCYYKFKRLLDAKLQAPSDTKASLYALHASHAQLHERLAGHTDRMHERHDDLEKSLATLRLQVERLIDAIEPLTRPWWRKVLGVK